MADIVIISVEDIIRENCRLTGIVCDSRRNKAVEGCYSSFYYYEVLQEQITSIVISLLKGHFFVDGNKRTALSTYLVLCQANGIKHIENEEEQVRIFIEIAASHKSIEECAKMLFPG